jgi:hypothetical protein
MNDRASAAATSGCWQRLTIGQRARRRHQVLRRQLLIPQLSRSSDQIHEQQRVSTPTTMRIAAAG